MRRGAIAAFALLALAACKPRPYPVNAEIDTSDPKLLRINVSSRDQGTFTILGTTGETDVLGKATVVISSAQLPPGPQFLRVSLNVGGRRGSTTVDFDRPLVTPSVKIGSLGYHSDTVTCSGDPCDGSLDAPKDGKLSIPVDAPPGCRIEILGKSTTIPVRYERFTLEDKYSSPLATPPERPSLEVEVKDPILDAVLPDALDRDKSLKVPMSGKVTCDEQTSDFAFVLDGSNIVRPSLTALLASVATQGITFGPTDVAPNGPKSALVMRNGTGLWYLGKPAKIRDLDLVAVTKYKSRSGGSCGPYQSYGGGPTFYAPLSISDEEVSVYDRRTGKLLKTQLLTGYGSCPDTVTGTSYNGGTPSAYVSGDVDSSRIDAFVKTFFK